MDIQKMRYFRAVAQTEHVSRAARLLHVSQPALSKAIAMLEDQLGVTLFTRAGRNITLNENGRVFLQYVDKALAALDNGIRFVREMNEEDTGAITFQTNITGDRYLIDLVKGFRRQHPHVRLELITNYSKSKYMIDCDCYITSSRISLYNCVSVPVFSEEIVLGVPAGHHLAGQKRISLSQAAGEHFIGITETQSWAQEVSEFCTEAGFKPHHVYICDRGETIAKLIAAGEGVGFLPAKSIGPHPDSISVLHIEHPSCHRHYNLSWQKDKQLSPQGMRFIEYVKSYFAALEKI